VHLEFFASIDEIALAKRELIEGLQGRESIAVLNADDSRVAQFAGVAPGKVLTFGIAATADFRAENISDRGADGSEFDFVGPEGKTRLALALAGRHNVSNALAALAAASAWGVGAADAKEVFPRLQPAGMRGGMIRYEEDFLVINDCYNSNPVALAAMIELLLRTPAAARHILAVGEMLELGPSSAELHREAGRAATQAGKLNWIIGVQGDSESFICGAIEGGHPEQGTRFFPTSFEAGKFIVDLISSGDVMLVKGSRGVKMEGIIEALDEKYTRVAAPTACSSVKERG
jgi:UDP-N-acetylmuramoyl-tripeptide--D-alanyl-D-alanine ligase